MVEPNNPDATQSGQYRQHSQSNHGPCHTPGAQPELYGLYGLPDSAHASRSPPGSAATPGSLPRHSDLMAPNYALPMDISPISDAYTTRPSRHAIASPAIRPRRGGRHGDNDRTPPADPAQTALTGHPATPSGGVADPPPVLITASTRIAAAASTPTANSSGRAIGTPNPGLQGPVDPSAVSVLVRRVGLSPADQGGQRGRLAAGGLHQRGSCPRQGPYAGSRPITWIGRDLVNRSRGTQGQERLGRPCGEPGGTEAYD